MKPRLTAETLSGADQRALGLFLRKVRGIYPKRLKQAILFGHKVQKPRGSDMDVLIVVKGMSDQVSEMGKLHLITGPIKTDSNILITAIPVDAAYLDAHRESSFFGDILRDGMVLGEEGSPS